MGLFSSKKKHYVDTSVVRVIEDDMIPDPHLEALVESIFDSKPLMPTIRQHALNGNFRQFHRMYNYADKGVTKADGEFEQYAYGLPNVRVLSNSDGYYIAIGVLEQEVGWPVDVDYLHYRPLNNIHAGWKHLTEEMAYTHDTNIIGTLTAQYGTDVYLDKMVGVYSTADGQQVEQSSMSTWGGSTSAGETPERNPWTNPAALAELTASQESRVGANETESVEIHYVWINPLYDADAEAPQEPPAANEGHPSQEILKDHLVVYLTTYDTDQEYYQAKYTYTTNTGTHYGYWVYDPKTGSSTELNTIFDTPEYIDPGTYFPFAVFRAEREDRAATKYHETDEYKTTTKLLDYLSMDFQEIADSLNENEDIGDIDQAVMMMAIPITSENEYDMEYLYRYFDDLHAKLPPEAQTTRYTGATDMDSPFGYNASVGDSYAIQITDADFDMTISFESITKRLVAGSIGEVGTYTNTQKTEETPVYPNLVFRGGIPAGVQTLNQRYLRKQITEGIYEEIHIQAPQIRYNIYKDKGAEGGAADERLLIPLDYDVVKKMSLFKMEQVYYRSLHFVFNSHVIQKIKWYQRGAFKILLIIAAIIIAITTQHWEAITASAAIGAGAVTMVIIKIIVLQILESIVFELVLTELVEEIGLEAALWLAAIVGVAGFVKSFGVADIVKWSTADVLLRASTGLAAGIQNVIGDIFKEIQEEYVELQTKIDEYNDELQRVEDLLGNALDLDPLTFVADGPLVIFGEAPESYYNRTIHAGNVGVESINIVQNFVNISLRLPTMQETIGETNYGL